MWVPPKSGHPMIIPAQTQMKTAQRSWGAQRGSCVLKWHSPAHFQNPSMLTHPKKPSVPAAGCTWVLEGAAAPRVQEGAHWLRGGGHHAGSMRGACGTPRGARGVREHYATHRPNLSGARCSGTRAGGGGEGGGEVGNRSAGDIFSTMLQL